MIIIILLVIKIALFGVPYHYANLAYADQMILKSYQSSQSNQAALRYWLYTGADLKQVVSVKMPEYLIAGETYPVNYGLIWGEIPDAGLVFQLSSSPKIGGLEDTITFDKSNKDVEGSITIPSSLQGDQPIKVVFSGSFFSEEMTSASISPMSGKIDAIPSGLIDALKKDRLKNGAIAVVSLIIALLIFIFIW